MNEKKLLCLGYRGIKDRIHSIKLANDVSIFPIYGTDIVWTEDYNGIISVYDRKNKSRLLMIDKENTKDVTYRCSYTSKTNIHTKSDEEFLYQVHKHIPSILIGQTLDNPGIQSLQMNEYYNTDSMTNTNINHVVLVVMILAIVGFIYGIFVEP